MFRVHTTRSDSSTPKRSATDGKVGGPRKFKTDVRYKIRVTPKEPSMTINADVVLKHGPQSSYIATCTTYKITCILERIVHAAIICLLGVSRPTREFFTHLETSPLLAKDRKLCPMLGPFGHTAVRFLKGLRPSALIFHEFHYSFSSSVIEHNSNEKLLKA